MLFPAEQAFVGRDEKRAPLKTLRGRLVSASQRVFQRLKLMDFEKRVANKRTPAQKNLFDSVFLVKFDSSQA